MRFVSKKMSHEVSTQWQGGMTFESRVNGHSIYLDADEKFGGRDLGPRPKPLLLATITGCTGMDVVSLLEKMRVSIYELNLYINGEVSETQPKVYTKIHLVYEVKLDDKDKDKMEKAVKLSQETMCGIGNMIRKAVQLTWEIRYM